MKRKDLAVLALYALVDLLLNFYTRNVDRTWYMYVWSTFTLLEYSIFTFFLWSAIKSRKARQIILWTSAVFFIFTTVFNVSTDFKNIDAIPIGIETILIFIYSFYFLYEQMNDTSTLFVYSKYQFWVVLGFLIYLAGSFFIYIFSSKWTSVDFFAKYWYVTNGFFAFMNVMFVVAFFMNIKSSRSVPKSKFSPFLN